MMSFRITLFLLLLSSQFCFAQTVQSTCTAHDTTVLKYKRDAERLTVRRVLYINSIYKDSVNINKTWRSKYLAALMAVYNATSLPQRDTVINLFKIHTDPSTELNMVSFKAPGTFAWMDSLNNSNTNTNYPMLDNIITTYSLHLWGYFVSTGVDVALFKSDSSINTLALANKFLNVSGIVDADPEPGYNDEKHITDSVNANSIRLTYSFGWGTCFNGCDKRRYWTFKTDSNCVVEFEKSYGDTLFTGIIERENELKDIIVFPNPFSERFAVKNDLKQDLVIELANTLGEIIFSSNWTENPGELQTGELPKGIYFITIRGTKGQKVIKVIKE